MCLSPLRLAGKMISRRKKMVIVLVCLSSSIYAVIHMMHYQEEFSPLQLLSSAEGEAQRLLKFLSSYHYQCNTTFHSSNYSDWALCSETEVGINLDPGISKIAYSVGPLPDYSFEILLSRNLSFTQFVFLHDVITATPHVLLQLNSTAIYHTTIVPNDPADFGRNSYEMQTINSIMAKLHHRHVDVLKIQSLQDVSHSYEVLYFMIKDGILSRFEQLYIALEIDKIDEDYMYSWYKTLYFLFHSAGFRLYHTAASSPLCLQVTLMESCHYYMSWLRNPGPQVFVLYPPAVDGSQQYEEQRLEDFINKPVQKDEDVIPVVLSPALTIRLSRRLLMSGTEFCNILVFQKESVHLLKHQVLALHIPCSITTVSPNSETMESEGMDFQTFTVSSEKSTQNIMRLIDISSQHLAARNTNIVYIDLIHNTWHFLTRFLDSGSLHKIDQLVIMTSIFKNPVNGNLQPAQTLRYQYSELQRVLAFQMTLLEAAHFPEQSLHFHTGDWWRLTFVKN